MWFEFSHFLCSFSSGLQALICWRLVRQGWSLNFINLLLALHFFFNTIISYIYLHLFFQLGSAHFMVETKDPEAISTICKHYVFCWIGMYTVGGIPSLGIVFCRFVYARYAHGLLADKGRLFHKVVLLVIFVFTIHWLLLWPAISINKDYKNIIKGKICNQLPFPEAGESLVEFHIKPKLLTCFSDILYISSLFYFQRSAKKQRSRHGIPRRRWNLMTIDLHAYYLSLTGFLILFDQLIINVIIQVFHLQLGAARVFKIWWIWHLCMFMIIHFISPLIIYLRAKREYPEFNGLQPKTFPGQEKPRVQPLIPRRRMSKVEYKVHEIQKKSMEEPQNQTKTRRQNSSYFKKQKSRIKVNKGNSTLVEIH